MEPTEIKFTELPEKLKKDFLKILKKANDQKHIKVEVEDESKNRNTRKH